jgi:hypothetical protein
MSKETYLKTLQRAFTDLHGCQAKHVETVPVLETFQGKTVWEGEVEVFDLVGHPKAKRGYAWSYANNGKSDQVTAVLELPPVISPKTAVQAAIISRVKN